MSNMIPQATVEALRSSHDVAIGAVGIFVKLFVPLNSTDLESLEAFRTTEDRMYTEYKTKAFIFWSPDTVQLRKLNIYTEDSLPILCQLPTDITQNIQVDSYLEVPIEEVPSDVKVNKFDIVNKQAPNIHDKIVFPTFVLVPRRT